MNQFLLMFVVSALLCGYDVYITVRSGGHNILALILAAVTAAIALFSLSQLVRRPNP